MRCVRRKAPSASRCVRSALTWNRIRTWQRYGSPRRRSRGRTRSRGRSRLGREPHRRGRQYGVHRATLGIARKPPIARGAGALSRAIADRPGLAREPSRRWVRSLGRIVTGRSELQPWRGDRRYADPAWKTNPFLRGARPGAHGHGLARSRTSSTAAALEPDVDYRLRLGRANLTAALAPPNVPLAEPRQPEGGDRHGRPEPRCAARRASCTTCGTPPRLPQRSDATDFRLGVERRRDARRVILQRRR